MRKDGYRNGVLTAIALLLGVMVLGQGAGPSPADAQVSHAGGDPTRPEGGGLISAAEQRKLILNEMRALRSQMDALQSTLAKGLSVKVTEMPEIRLPKDQTQPAGG